MRPREKLLRGGPEELTDQELLAVFLGAGTSGQPVLQLAGSLLEHFSGTRGLMRAPVESLLACRGVGPAKAAIIIAAIELSKRCLQDQLKKGGVISDPDASRMFLQLRLGAYQREVFACLFLDSQHRLISYEELFFGTIDGASVYPREVVSRALLLNAAAVILAHNHPSGISEPSEADRRITDRLRSALLLIDVRVLDHLVIGDGEVTSFAERGLI